MSDFVRTVLIVTILRAVMVLAGVAFAYMGYRLFVRGIYDSTSDLHAVWADKKLAITKAGPGIFFALFGVVVVATSVWRGTGLSQSPSSATDNAATDDATQAERSVEPPFMQIDAQYITVSQLLEKSSADFEEEWGMADRAILFNSYIRAHLLRIPPELYNEFVTTTYVPVLKQQPGQDRAANLDLAHRKFFAGFEQRQAVMQRTLNLEMPEMNDLLESLDKPGLGGGLGVD